MNASLPSSLYSEGYHPLCFPHDCVPHTRAHIEDCFTIKWAVFSVLTMFHVYVYLHKRVLMYHVMTVAILHESTSVMLTGKAWNTDPGLGWMPVMVLESKSMGGHLPLSSLSPCLPGEAVMRFSHLLPSSDEVGRLQAPPSGYSSRIKSPWARAGPQERESYHAGSSGLSTSVWAPPWGGASGSWYPWRLLTLVQAVGCLYLTVTVSLYQLNLSPSDVSVGNRLSLSDNDCVPLPVESVRP